MPKPTAGWYRLTTPGDPNANPPVPPYTVNYQVTDAGIQTTFGLLVYEAAGDAYRRGDIAISCTGEGTSIAVNGNEMFPNGTCVKL